MDDRVLSDAGGTPEDVEDETPRTVHIGPEAPTSITGFGMPVVDEEWEVPIEDEEDCGCGGKEIELGPNFSTVLCSIAGIAAFTVILSQVV